MEANNTLLTLKVMDFEENLLINKIKLCIYYKYIDINEESIEIKIDNFPENVNDFYVEKIELFLKENPNEYKRHFRVKIRKGQNNIYGIFLNKLNNFSFEIIYFNKISNIPPNIVITADKKDYTLEESCKSDLPFIKKFGIINCDKSITINKKEEIFITEDKKGSFEIDLIYIDSNKNCSVKIKKIHKEN